MATQLEWETDPTELLERLWNNNERMPEKARNWHVVDSQNPSLILQRYFDVNFLLVIRQRKAPPKRGPGVRKPWETYRPVC